MPQFYISLVLIASIVHHVISLDAVGIAVTVVILAYYSTSRASKSFPGSFWPGMELNAKSAHDSAQICNCHHSANFCYFLLVC